MKNSDSADAQAPPRAVRHRLPAERASVTHSSASPDTRASITVAASTPTASPARSSSAWPKEGSTVSGLMDSLRHGNGFACAPARRAAARCSARSSRHTRFEPSGWTGNEQIGYAKSIMDYIFRAGSRSASSPATSSTSSPASGHRRAYPGGGHRHCSSQHRQPLSAFALKRRVFVVCPAARWKGPAFDYDSSRATTHTTYATPARESP